jgi:hypothetical protein
MSTSRLPTLVGTIAALSLVLAPSGAAVAQSGGIEVGAGFAALAYNHYSAIGIFDSYSTTDFGIGGQRASIAFYVTPRVAVEPSVLYRYSHESESGQASITNTSLMLDVAIPFYLGAGGGHSGPFVAPLAGISRYSSTGNSAQQFVVGGDVGTKLQLNDRVSFRLAAEVVEGLKHESDGLPSSTTVAGIFGVSVFLK